MRHVAIVALPSVVAFDLAVPAQVFGHLDERDRYQVTVCASAPGLVPSTTGFEISVSAGLEALDTADTVVVPGYVPHAPPAMAVLEALRAAAGRGARLLSVCTGAFALAAAGLLDGRRAATHWRDAAELAAHYPAVDVDADVLYVSDEPVLTSAGIAAGLDLCLHVVRVDYGEDVAAEVARRMVVAPHRAGGQAQFLHRPVPAAGTGLAPTCAWALTRLPESLSVADLARHAGWAPRTFARRFRARNRDDARALDHRPATPPRQTPARDERPAHRTDRGPHRPRQRREPAATPQARHRNKPERLPPHLSRQRVGRRLPGTESRARRAVVSRGRCCP